MKKYLVGALLFLPVVAHGEEINGRIVIRSHDNPPPVVQAVAPPPQPALVSTPGAIIVPVRQASPQPVVEQHPTVIQAPQAQPQYVAPQVQPSYVAPRPQPIRERIPQEPRAVPREQAPAPIPDLGVAQVIVPRDMMPHLTGRQEEEHRRIRSRHKVVHHKAARHVKKSSRHVVEYDEKESGTMQAREGTLVYLHPEDGSKVLKTLREGDVIKVFGKVLGKDWLVVEWNKRMAFIHQ